MFANMFCFGVLALALFSGSPMAADYPERNLRFLVAWPAGGSADVLARFVSQKLEPVLGKSIVIENRPGASGNIGAAAVAQAPADGYTLLLTVGAITIAPALLKNPGYDVERDLRPLVILGETPFLLIVNAAVPVKSAGEFLGYAKAQGGRLNFANGGSGTIPYLLAEVFRAQAGIDFQQITHPKGGIQALQELAAGRSDFTIDGGPHVKQQLDSQKVRALASASKQRVRAYPDLPTMQEAGLPAIEGSTWTAFFVPRATPEPIVRKLNTEIVRILRDPGMIERFRQASVEPIGNTVEEAELFVAGQIRKWAEAARIARIKPE